MPYLASVFPHVHSEAIDLVEKMLTFDPTQRITASVFPHVHSEAIDLVEKMLTFDPTQRITVEEALAHPYLARLHNTDYEPICPKPFSFDFEKQPLMEEEMKEMIYEEALSFNPGKTLSKGPAQLEFFISWLFLFAQVLHPMVHNTFGNMTVEWDASKNNGAFGVRPKQIEIKVLDNPVGEVFGIVCRDHVANLIGIMARQGD
ncbi:hypothetical protein IFM89_000316 [Coptis chinensis]|uniref:Protein kinase domain-containing protein n=1 Tax=Coptis chinensis TaxID=261450 RepID=A0A835HC24_9MAGN|nr:hypothetical protein IFM89_000316 [Coptis chinensis]